MDTILESLKETYIAMEKQEEIPLEFPKAPKPDIRTIGMITVMFDDWAMNGTSPYKFSVETPKWRKMQKKLKLGDYGGNFDPEHLLGVIENLVGEVEAGSLSGTGDLNVHYAEAFGVDNAMKILQSLKKIAEVAQASGVNVRAINSQVV
jgi:hypothetical protein